MSLESNMNMGQMKLSEWNLCGISDMLGWAGLKSLGLGLQGLQAQPKPTEWAGLGLAWAWARACILILMPSQNCVEGQRSISDLRLQHQPFSIEILE
jgi:hypothetical protein